MRHATGDMRLAAQCGSISAMQAMSVSSQCGKTAVIGPSGHPPLRILAHMDARSRVSREGTRGIRRYAATHPGVEVRLFGPGTASAKLQDFRDWRPDGLIMGGPPRRTLAEAMRMGVRAAVLGGVEPPKGVPLRMESVFVDNAAVAEGAAKHFATCRVRNLAFVGERMAGKGGAEWTWSAERDAAFRECAAKTGRSYASFGPVRAAPNGGVRERRALARWIAALPKPVGILAARDHVAVNVLEACLAAGVAVPQSALVLGVDDDEFICPDTPPTLSSIVLDYEGGGYLMAETLVGLLKGEERRASAGFRLVHGIRGVVARQSTSDRNEARLMVSRAEEFIRANAATGGIDVEDVAKAVFASVSLLEKNFKVVTGGTVCRLIQDVRLERVRTLLTETQTPIGEIGPICGFESSGYLKELFRNRFGCTMRDWRKSRR